MRKRVAALISILVGLTPAVAAGQGILTAYWDPNPPADEVSSYQVCLGTTSFSCNVSEARVPSSETFFAFTPSPGVLYRFAVRAISDAGTSEYSSEVTASIPNLVQPANQYNVVSVPITPLNLSASDPDGGSLQFTHTGLPLGLQLNRTTGQITGTPTAAGTYNVSIGVFDGLLTTFRSFVWTIGEAAAPPATTPGPTAGGGGGSLAGAVTTSTAAVNLTTEGSVDWVHWGDATLTRKAGVAAQLSNYTRVGTGPVLTYFDDLREMSWTGGTPTASGTNNKRGVYIQASGNGFSFTAPADQTSRRLIVHVGGYLSGGRLTARLSDGSAVDYSDTAATATDVANNYDRNYTLTYRAASAGRLLTVTWVMTSGGGNVSLSAAALSVVAAP